MNKSLLLFFLMPLFSLASLAQPTTTVSGIVGDEHGVLAGVSVQVKGSDRQVVTDAEGRYSMTVHAGEVLLFSNIGYDPVEEVIGDRRVINVTLRASISSLDEVVVVGYGTQSRRNVTGSVSK